MVPQHGSSTGTSYPGSLRAVPALLPGALLLLAALLAAPPAAPSPAVAPASTIAPAPTPPAAADSEESEEDDDRLEVRGDARFRLEDNRNRGALPDRFRTRLRLRLGATYRVHERLSVGGRLTTGDPDDPNSPYRDLGDVFDRFPVSLDRLYLSWRPGPGVELTGGKFAHPFVTNPVYGELVWDQDVQPEGAAVTYLRKGSEERWSLRLAAGTYVVLEQGAADEASATVVQAAGELAVRDGVRVAGALGLYEYSALAPDGAGAVLRDNAGNATVDRDGDGRPDGFASDFRILDAMLHLRTDLAGRTLWLGGQYVRNLEAVVPGRRAWALGLALGDLDEPGGWRGRYQYQHVERDAVLSPFAQDDFPFQTGFRGHLFGATYRVSAPLDVHAWALVARPDEGGPGGERRTRWRLRLDATVGF